jgi:hypothetical protein
MFVRSLLAILSLLVLSVHAKSVDNFLPAEQKYLGYVPTPEQVLGYQVAQRYVRHDELLNYFEALKQSSKRLMLTNMGYSNQHRKQMLVTISSPENLANLDNILTAKKNATLNGKLSNGPLVVWLSYSVHGDEAAGANAAMVVAYHLLASQSVQVKALLSDTVIVLEPTMNPDGMARFVNWQDTFKSSAFNANPDHIEHFQGWPTGRGNHFSVDLNRDWLLLSQKESQNRLPYFHFYQPHVLSDFHEMSANKTYFFQPGVSTRTNPLTPKNNVQLTRDLSLYHAKTLDEHQQLYFTEEEFDDFYYGKGSTYPDINGSIGILLEQANSKGLAQHTANGLLTFADGVQNHVLTSLSTIEGAWQNRQKLKQYQQTFYQQAIDEAQEQSVNGYFVSEAHDNYRLNAFLDKLAAHQIKVYPLVADYEYKDKVYGQEYSYFVPLEQPQYRVIQAIFSQPTQFSDNSFYDVSGWTLPLAMNIEFYGLEKTRGLKVAKNVRKASSFRQQTIDNNSYAYVFEWQNFLAPKLLNQLLNANIQVKVATKAFSSTVLFNGEPPKKRQFNAGTIVIPAGLQQVAAWQKSLVDFANDNQIPLFSLNTGLTKTGIDLGSSSMVNLSPVNVLLVGGQGVSEYEVGEIRYYLDELQNIPVTIVEKKRLANIQLGHYSHVIMVDGDYQELSEQWKINLTDFVNKGGVIVGQKTASKWLAHHEFLNARFVSQSTINTMFDTDNLSYQDKDALAARKRIAGAIFETTLDLSHPLAYGFTRTRLPIFKNSTLIFDKTSFPFISVANYSQTPLLSGYTDKFIVNQIAGNSAVIAHNIGLGRVIATTDNLSFRGYWHGSHKLLLNSLFFAKAFDTPIK